MQGVKRGAHAEPFLLTAPSGWASVEEVYGERNLCVREDWDMQGATTGGVGGGARAEGNTGGVRIITLAPEVDGVMDVIAELNKRGVVVSIGHR